MGSPAIPKLGKIGTQQDSRCYLALFACRTASGRDIGLVLVLRWYLVDRGCSHCGRCLVMYGLICHFWLAIAIWSTLDRVSNLLHLLMNELILFSTRFYIILLIFCLIWGQFCSSEISLQKSPPDIDERMNFCSKLHKTILLFGKSFQKSLSLILNE